MDAQASDATPSSAQPARDPLTLVRGARTRILALAARYGASDVRVFGSVARGATGPASDIDFVVRLDPGRTLLDLGGLQYALQELLGRDVDVLVERGLPESLARRIALEAQPL